MRSYISLGIFNLIDVIATICFYNTGMFVELNPFMAYLLNNPILFVITKIGVMAFLLLWLWKERASRYANIAVRIGLVMYGIIAAYYGLIWLWIGI